MLKPLIPLKSLKQTSLLLILLLLTPLNPPNKLGQSPLLPNSPKGDLAIAINPFTNSDFNNFDENPL
jgi:hypothetical protein